VTLLSFNELYPLSYTEYRADNTVKSCSYGSADLVNNYHLFYLLCMYFHLIDNGESSCNIFINRFSFLHATSSNSLWRARSCACFTLADPWYFCLIESTYPLSCLYQEWSPFLILLISTFIRKKRVKMKRFFVKKKQRWKSLVSWTSYI